MIEVNKFKIGVFAVSGIVVMLGAVLLFGGSDIFKNEVKLVTLYDESVQGLEKVRRSSSAAFPSARSPILPFCRATAKSR